MPRPLLAATVAVLTAVPAAHALAPRPARDILSQTLATERAHRVHDLRYDLRFRFTAAGDTYTGEATLHFGDRQPKTDLTLDYVGRHVDAVILNGTTLDQPYNGAFLTLPGRLLKADNTVVVRFTAAFDTTSDGMIRFVDPVDGKIYLYSNFEPFGAHRLFPCFDQPDLKARYTLHAETPADWTVIGNLPPTRIVKQGDRQTADFPPTPPLSPYLVALHTGNYAAWHDNAGKTPLSIYARASLARYVDAPAIFAITRKGLSWYGDYFARPYPFTKYDHVFVPEFAPGAMENPGAVTMNERMIYRHPATNAMRLKRDNTILHEMAHMWFGDLVTMRWWNDLWLNESFATYMASLANEAIPRYGDSWLNFQNRKVSTYLIDEQVTTHPIEAHIPDTDAASENFDGITYGKGASAMKQLAFTLGPKAFQAGVRTYFQRHAWSNTTLADFMAALQTQTRQDLSRWSHAWIRTAGLNAVVPDWTSAKGRISRFELRQTAISGDALLRPHRTAIGLYGRNAAGDLVLQATVPATYTGARTPVPSLVGKPAPAFVFANAGDQDYAKADLDPASLATVKQDLHRIRDPFVRQQVWTALWMMVRDQQLDAPAFLDLVRAHLPHETEATVIDTQLDRLSTAVFQYLDRADRNALAPGLEDFLWTRAKDQAPGSDAQQVWVGHAIHLSRTPAGLAHSTALLDGSETFPGLKVDQDRRWSILHILAATGTDGITERLADELKRDPSDAGRKAWESAMAARPDAAYKAQLWDRFLTDRTTSLLHLRAAMGGFHGHEQEALMRPYTDKFFAVIPDLYRSRDINFAGTFAKSLYPTLTTSDSLAKAEALLKRADLSPELRKLTLERIEAAKRRQRTQVASHQALAARVRPAGTP